jgi:CheY-like chemotaxis protein
MWDTTRQHERIPVSLGIVLEASSGRHDARISDLSWGGCFIDTIGHVSAGETIIFQIHLPTGHWGQLYGEVIYCLPSCGFGLRFIRLAEEEHIVLEQLIVAYGRKPSSLHESAGVEKEKPSVLSSRAVQRVLLADVDPTVRHLVTEIIRKEGYEVVAAKNRREAQDILQTDSDYIAAIFDIAIPRMQGLDLVRYMKVEKRLQRIPVGIITAEQEPKLWHESLAAGAVVFLSKPFMPAQVRYMLKVLISQNQV